LEEGFAILGQAMVAAARASDAGRQPEG